LKNIIRLVTVCTIGLALFVTGCSKNQPCATDPSQIESARSELQTAQGQLDSAKAQLETEKSKQADLQKKLENLPDKSELDEHLDTLKKGSGR
jgi:peptidoglycan hydrolase CwlO-like protein